MLEICYCYMHQTAQLCASSGTRVRAVGRRSSSVVADKPNKGGTHAITTHPTIRPWLHQSLATAHPGGTASRQCGSAIERDWAAGFGRHRVHLSGPAQERQWAGQRGL